MDIFFPKFQTFCDPQAYDFFQNDSTSSQYNTHLDYASPSGTINHDSSSFPEDDDLLKMPSPAQQSQEKLNYSSTRHSASRRPPKAISNDVFTFSQEILEDIKHWAVVCKRDWKKVSNKIEKFHNVKINPYDLRMATKQLEEKDKKRNNFANVDDDLLLSVVESEGKNWIEISKKHFSGMCPISIRNRYYVIVSKSKNSKFSKKKPNNSLCNIRNSRINSAPFQVENVKLDTLVTDLQFKEDPEWFKAINSLLWN